LTDWLPPHQRVVITGMGAVTPNGLTIDATWQSVRAGRSGIAPITLFDASDFNVKIAGEAHGFDALEHMSRKEVRRTDRYAQFALVAADEAAAQARLAISESESFDVGVYIGCGAGGIWSYQEQQYILSNRGPGHLSPMLIPMIVTDSGSVQVGIRLGARGPNMGPSSACSTSLDSVGLALETIRRGDASVMIAGGSGAAVNTLGIGGFDRLGALSRRNDAPAGASRPFDAERDGFVVSEGAVVMVLESLEHARARGAEPIAEILSYASTSDARHLTAPDSKGLAAIRCMERALSKGGLEPGDVDYINAHATGTPLGDPIEVAAIKSLMNDDIDDLLVSSTKSCTGHLLGAAGALAISLTALSLKEGFVPPTINLDHPDAACVMNHVAHDGRQADIRVGLVPSYGFGGHNSCVVVAKFDEGDG
jgi:beta-ketoacyl-acyl-carrier-protein synthase II